MVRSSKFAMSPRLQDSCSLTRVLYDMPEDRSSVWYTSGSNRERSSSYMSHLRWPPVGDGCGAGAARSLVGGVRWRESAAPVVTKGAQVSILGDRIGEGLAGGARGGSGAAGAGESESPPGGVEVRAIREGEQGLVAEGGGDGTVKRVRHVSPFAGFL